MFHLPCSQKDDQMWQEKEKDNGPVRRISGSNCLLYKSYNLNSIHGTNVKQTNKQI